MDAERFRAYSFVDRIESVEPGTRIRGSYAIPAGLRDFPPALAAEAVGQLAAWLAMAELDFTVRPVAGIAAGVELEGCAEPGETLELEAEIEALDAGAMGYGGTARVAGRPVVRLRHCVGPMVPMEDFDDPAAVRARHELLCGAGADPGAFEGVPEIAWERLGGEAGSWMNARLQVPERAAFFGDHFPRRPVFPGTLMVDTNNAIATAFLAEEVPPGKGRAWKVRHLDKMKMRSFIPPGTRLESRVEIVRRDGESADIAVESRNGKRRVSSGQLRMMVEEVKS